MSITENEWVAIGARCSTQRMLEQLPVSIAAARAYEVELGGMFPATKTAELSTFHSSIETLFREQADGKFEAYTGNVGVSGAMRTLKECIRDIVSAADNAFEEEPAVRDQFHQTGPLGRTVSTTIRKSESIIALAEKNAASLAEWGVTAAEILSAKTALEALTAANTSQERGMLDLPPKTRKLYETKGRAYLLLKKLARAGRRRFASDPSIAAKFGLEILHRKAPPKMVKNNDVLPAVENAQP